MATSRCGFEPGHRPKCLVVVDDSAEWDRAVRYASRWALRIGGSIVMLRIVETENRKQEWLGVAEIMRAEALEDGYAALDTASELAASIGSIVPERVVREGEPASQILEVIAQDGDIVLLVLAAGTESEGPGPITSALIHALPTLPIPLALVPAHLDDPALDTLI
jgi:nucleotide-binding universal stress UspA family protein